ncbi:MAG: putative gamma-glutamyltransferase YwrD [Candidatus Izimaplasma bacterium HR2]|nr:MAG: putative gamma-glutamyltransferase YwrD [Candidatus Izimaplasma bacterium HR2]
MNNEFFSKRQSVYAKNGVIATSEGLASQAGLEILKKGGNAIDAAVATAAALTVVEPTSNGIGSDCFALVYFNDKLHGMNSSGYSSKNINIEEVKKRGFDEMPTGGVVPITVPGTPKGWARLIQKFGTMSLIEVLTPAIKLAREGFIISETVGFYFERAMKAYKARHIGEEYNHFFKVFTKDGVSYKSGDFFKSDYHAETLREIGESNSDSFYTGKLSKKIVSFMEKHNGFIDASDLAEFDAEFVEPISINYKGYDVCEIPPNGQGITALMALNLLKDEEFIKDDINTLHRQIEALKIAFSDTLKYVTDSKFMKVNPNFLLSDEYVKLRKKDIGNVAKKHEPIDYEKAGTVYLATADKDGNMVSFIQSNYMGFGSGIVIDDTGIAMQNRGHTFSLDENHHNKLEPRKRTFHTIIPGFIMKDGKALGPFGVMGGFMQPQGHLQVVMNMIDFKMDPQSALDAPRFRWDEGLKVGLESKFDNYVAQKLQQLGHHITIDLYGGGFGRGQIILKEKNGYKAGTETRCDGFIAYY